MPLERHPAANHPFAAQFVARVAGDDPGIGPDHLSESRGVGGKIGSPAKFEVAFPYSGGARQNFGGRCRRTIGLFQLSGDVAEGRA